MADPIKLGIAHCGEDYRFDPDVILEEAKGQGFTDLVVIGFDKNGDLWVSGNANAGETLILMERAKQYLIFGD